MSTLNYALGQRWVSNSEVELGLGIVKEIAGRRVLISFPAVSEERLYATETAPLSRIIYSVDDRVKTNEGHELKITELNTLNDCVVYHCLDSENKAITIHELDLSSHVQLSQPQDRLFAGQIDKNRQFELRTAALAHQHRLQQSSAYGLMGPRVQLLPHQFYIAHQVSKRFKPRALLADEVGLGKTIQAGLIIHQQLLTGHADRVLILVPDSLIHQWLVELLRRFNLHFSIIDELESETLNPEDNPFAMGQLLLCPLSLLAGEKQEIQRQLAIGAQWDLLVVDEAHHLQWSEREASPEYQCVEQLAEKTRGLLLLTATPEQLGIESHFARLRLLDPKRYYDFEQFKKQEAAYEPISRLVDTLLGCETLEHLQSINAELANFIDITDIDNLEPDQEIEPIKQQFVNDLLDLHGTSRVLFRNTRHVIKGFPKRVLNQHPLKAPERYRDRAFSSEPKELMQAEFLLGEDWLTHDPRVAWLAQWLTEHPGQKILVICAQASTAQDLEQCLRLKFGKRSAAFHEGLSIVNRDRAAAYFADNEAGAQILVCSEIGSEGRNFQFSHHLVLFDLPLDPDLLEQRIGRLDRIGQTADIQIHVPYFENSAQEVMLRWYHQGLNAFESIITAGKVLFDNFSAPILSCIQAPNDLEAIEQLISETSKVTKATIAKLEKGRNHLLELNSCKPEEAEELIAEIEYQAQSQMLSQFMEHVFSEYGVEQQSDTPDSVIIRPGNEMREAQFPGLPDDGLKITHQRHRALHREDISYVNWEHPIVTGSMDMIIRSEFGNAAFCTLSFPSLKPGTLLIEAIFKIQVIAPKALQVDRFFNNSYLRIISDEHGRNYNTELDESSFNNLVGRIPKATKQALVKQARSQIEKLIAKAEQLAMAQKQGLIEAAILNMNQSLSDEHHRLAQLAKVNPAIDSEELMAINEKQDQLSESLQSAQLNLDAIRIAIVDQE